MRTLAALVGGALLAEGAIKQLWPKEWINWLVEQPIAYMPEPIVKVNREYRGLSAGALRFLGLLELLAGATILWLVASSARRCDDRKPP